MSLDVDLIAPRHNRIPHSELDVLYTNNITHNMTHMAAAAGLYQCLWRPEEISCNRAYQLQHRLNVGLTHLSQNPEEYKKYEPENGWGSWETFVGFCMDYLDACNKYPGALIRVSR